MFFFSINIAETDFVLGITLSFTDMIFETHSHENIISHTQMSAVLEIENGPLFHPSYISNNIHFVLIKNNFWMVLILEGFMKKKILEIKKIIGFVGRHVAETG